MESILREIVKDIKQEYYHAEDTIESMRKELRLNGEITYFIRGYKEGLNKALKLIEKKTKKKIWY